MELYNEKIFIAEISLHYETRPTIIHEWTRERYCREIAERRRKKDDWWIKRVTLAEANRMIKQESKERYRKEYDQAIMNKYNVGPNYKENRWFMEQVRPQI